MSCRAICHESCVDALNGTFRCRQTFREDIRKYREQIQVEHHWVNKRSLKVLNTFFTYVNTILLGRGRQNFWLRTKYEASFP